MNFKRVLGIALIFSGAVLALFFWDLHVKWFQGGPFGLLLLVIGVFDLWDGHRESRGKKTKGIVDEIRGDLGIDSSRPRESDEPK